jgi:transcriptional regulator of acetoin/glycerol metabolism
MNHLNHHTNSTDSSEDSKMQTEHNGSNGQQLQYITLGNNIPATSATTPTSDSKGGNNNGGPKTWTPSDMEAALEALRSHNMSLTKASATYGIPSTTLWQRAHRLGIGEY